MWNWPNHPKFVTLLPISSKDAKERGSQKLLKKEVNQAEHVTSHMVFLGWGCQVCCLAFVVVDSVVIH